MPHARNPSHPRDAVTTPDEVKPARQTAGVLAPPPLLPLAVMLVAEALRFWRPLSLPGLGTDTWRLTLAAVLFAAALSFGGYAVLTMRRARTPVEPWKQTRTIVQAGPYTISRNPIYLSFLGVQLAYAWARPNGWGILLLPVTVLLLHWAVIRREERYLTKLFGDEYVNYTRGVRRWI